MNQPQMDHQHDHQHHEGDQHGHDHRPKGTDARHGDTDESGRTATHTPEGQGDIVPEAPHGRHAKP